MYYFVLTTDECSLQHCLECCSYLIISVELKEVRNSFALISIIGVEPVICRIVRDAFTKALQMTEYSPAIKLGNI